MSKAVLVGIWLAVVLLLANGALAVVRFRDHRDERAFDLEERREQAAQAQRARDAATPQKVAIERYCSGNIAGFHCTFTNPNPVVAASVCQHGKIAQKENHRVSLTSLTLCSGALEPMQTREVAVPWNGGQADEICNKPGAFGPTLDWSKCTFDTLDK